MRAWRGRHPDLGTQLSVTTRAHPRDRGARRRRSPSVRSGTAERSPSQFRRSRGVRARHDARTRRSGPANSRRLGRGPEPGGRPAARAVAPSAAGLGHLRDARASGPRRSGRRMPRRTRPSGAACRSAGRWTRDRSRPCRRQPAGRARCSAPTENRWASPSSAAERGGRAAALSIASAARIAGMVPTATRTGRGRWRLPEQSATGGTKQEHCECNAPDDDPHEQDPVARPSELSGTKGGAPAREGGRHLPEHHGKNAAPEAARSGSVGEALTRPPSGDQVREEEGGHRHQGLRRAEDPEDPGEQGRSRRWRRGGGPSITRVPGGSAPSASAGSRSVPMSRHSTCSTVSASGMRPPDSAHTTNGVSSATLSVR